MTHKNEGDDALQVVFPTTFEQIVDSAPVRDATA